MEKTLSGQCKYWVFLVETPIENRELRINNDDVIQNADDEVDVPLDIVLKRYNMDLKDLFQLDVDQIKLIEISNNCRKIIRSISFEYLRYNQKDVSCESERMQL